MSDERISEGPPALPNGAVELLRWQDVETGYWRCVDNNGVLYAVSVQPGRGWVSMGCTDEARRRLAAELAACRARIDEATALRAWQDAVVAEVVALPGLPCNADEVTIEYVPALLAVLAGRVEHADDYDGTATTATPTDQETAR